LGVAILLVAGAAPNAWGADGRPVAGPATAPHIVNLVGDFLAYADQCKALDAGQRAARWDAMIEAKHADFINQVIYRKKQGAERERYKRWVIEHFWTDVIGKLDDVRKLNADIAARIAQATAQFRKSFPDFSGVTDYYVTISFGFAGKVDQVNGRAVFAIGLEKFAPDSANLEMTIAHELFHLYHFQTFSTAGGLYRQLWAEGLATWASMGCVPGHRYSAYLGFSGEKMNQCQKLLPKMAAQLRQNMGGQRDPKLERAYFGAEDNDMGIPPAGGYYVGLLVCEALSKQYTVAQMARLDADTVYRLVEAQLRGMEK
jgi:hypothetical protein